MRRTDREVKSFDEIIGILEKCKVLHLAMIREGKPYSVPVNFGYIMNEVSEGERPKEKNDLYKRNGQILL